MSVFDNVALGVIALATMEQGWGTLVRHCGDHLVTVHLCLYIPIVSKKKLTLLNSLPNKRCETFSGKFSYVWMVEGLIYHMTPKNLKLIYASVSTGHFCKGYEN